MTLNTYRSNCKRLRVVWMMILCCDIMTVIAREGRWFNQLSKQNSIADNSTGVIFVGPFNSLLLAICFALCSFCVSFICLLANDSASFTLLILAFGLLARFRLLTGFTGGIVADFTPNPQPIPSVAVFVKFRKRLNLLAVRAAFGYDCLRHILNLPKIMFRAIGGLRPVCGSFYCIGGAQ